jgi:hypothetical protein
MAKRAKNKSRKSTARNHRRKRNERECKHMNEVLYFSSMLLAMMASVIFHLTSYIPFCSYDSHRVRKDLEKDIFEPLGDYYLRRAYRMDKATFYKLHEILDPLLLKHFFPRDAGSRDVYSNPYLIRTEIRLSIALRYFAGASPYDLVVTHGVSMTSVFFSIWGVIDCVNKCSQFEIRFPDYKTQKDIADGFKKRSGAKFEFVMGAIDGILIWILKPFRQECRLAECGEKSFNCSRKDKYGLNMQAICDDELRFFYIDLSWPGATADYLAWITSGLCMEIEMSMRTAFPKIAEGYTLIGDNAYVKTKYMTVPIKAAKTEVEDSYNFYQSQLRITIEHAFGVLVHRWSILRGPLNIPLFKVVPLVNCLVKLHNFCINERLHRNENSSLQGMMIGDAKHLNRLIIVIEVYVLLGKSLSLKRKAKEKTREEETLL